MDWTKSMIQTFEFYLVDPRTFRDIKMVDGVTKFDINRDLSSDLIDNITIDCPYELGENYIRCYLIAKQGAETQKVPLGTFLIQSPNITYDGKSISRTYTGYSCLIELKDSLTPLGYSVLKGANVMQSAITLIRDNMRPPVVLTSSDHTLNRNFSAGQTESVLSFSKSLIEEANYTMNIDPMGRLYFEPKRDASKLYPTWSYDDENMSILSSNIQIKSDLYGTPNVVEVVYSVDGRTIVSRVENNDPASASSTVRRGREIIFRDTNPSLPGEVTKEYLDLYAIQLLKSKSVLNYEVTYSHGYCPVVPGDSVFITCKKLGIVNAKAQVQSQSITGQTGITINETAVFTKELWDGKIL